MMEIGIDLANGKDFTVDNLTRHKWPEEKPEEPNQYLVRLDNGYYPYYEKARWKLGGWKSTDSNFVGRDISEFVTHWWELPEVTE